MHRLALGGIGDAVAGLAAEGFGGGTDRDVGRRAKGVGGICVARTRESKRALSCRIEWQGLHEQHAENYATSPLQ
jgi:hypothetical protein